MAKPREVAIVFRSRPAWRWLAPAVAAVVVVGGGAAAGTIVANADPSLPARSAEQLLADLRNTDVDGLVGTIVQSAELGIPGTGGNGPGAAADLAALFAGITTARIWHAPGARDRLALLGPQGETDLIRNGSDLWVWNSIDKKANHLNLPARRAEPGRPDPAAVDLTTGVTTTGAVTVAGRDAYELVLSPKDKSSLIGQVRLAIDAEHHIPLRVDVYAKNATSPAVRVAFQQISFAVPDAEQFTFNPPPGTKVTNSTGPALTEQHKAEIEKRAAAAKPELKGGSEPSVIGTGWTSVVTANLPKTTGKDATPGQPGQDLTGALDMLPKASGTWGTGHIFAGTLFSVLVTDDGKVFAGAVAPEKLYELAAK